MAWISEIHYQNGYAGASGVAEFVEIALSPGEFARASDFEFATYQDTGTSSLVVSLDTLTPVIDPDNGFYIYTITVLTTDPDSGTPGTGDAEAVALVDNSLGSPVLEFYDIGGGTTAITATDGPASGATSTNIPGSAGGTSIQFTKRGVRVDGALTQNSAVICFGEKTLIETIDGQIPVEELCTGDLVRNDRGEFVPLRWIGSRSVSHADLARNFKLSPVRIMAGALGKGLPERDLLVSRQHRILISSRIAERVTGEREVLVPAIKLIDLPGIFIDRDVEEIRYFHLLFDCHEIVFAEGTAAESLFMGGEAIKTLSLAARSEIADLFPHLNWAPQKMTVRHVPDGRMQKVLVARHAKNSQPLQTARQT